MTTTLLEKLGLKVPTTINLSDEEIEETVASLEPPIDMGELQPLEGMTLCGLWLCAEELGRVSLETCGSGAAQEYRAEIKLEMGESDSIIWARKKDSTPSLALIAAIREAERLSGRAR